MHLFYYLILTILEDEIMTSGRGDMVIVEARRPADVNQMQCIIL